MKKYNKNPKHSKLHGIFKPQTETDLSKLRGIELSSSNKISFNKEELSAVYKIIKDYEKDASEEDKDYYDDFYDTYEKPIKRKILKTILNKINLLLPKEKKEEIDKDFLRKKYHTFNNDIDERVYRIIEKAFSKLKTIELKYFKKTCCTSYR